MHSKIKIGQIGNGRFGKKILSKLGSIENLSIEWVCDSQDIWWEQALVDWVIIATPVEFHYEQAKHFLQLGINVFCEKPGTLCSDSLEELVELSKTNSTLFYVDDVLIYENIKTPDCFVYKKWGGRSTNIIDRIAYHHFYLLYEDVNDHPLTNIIIKLNETGVKIFELEFTNKKYKFEYDFNWYGQKIDNIAPPSGNDALKAMLQQVLNKETDFSKNHLRSLFALRLAEYVKSHIYGKCAVVGAGIYGITAAIKLSTLGYCVELFEAEDDILKATSSINQYRIHRGYHYPRSHETIESCKNSIKGFTKLYNSSIMHNDTKHYYAISKEGSLTTAEEFLSVLDKHKLDWRIVDNQLNCELTIEVNEKLFDPKRLKAICQERIKGNGIRLRLNERIKKGGIESDDYKYKVYATYSSLNDLSPKKRIYQFELVEKPVFRLPQDYKNISMVVMDGPFMCFDPFADTEYHVGGNVVHAIHHTNKGINPEIPSKYRKYINKGLIVKPEFTKAKDFITSAGKFFPGIERAEHIGSMYTIRTVLPNYEKTDARPALVEKYDNQFVVFSGKIGNCVEVSNTIASCIKSRDM